MEADEIEDSVAAIREEVIEETVAMHIPPGSLDEQWDTDGLAAAMESEYGVSLEITRMVREDPNLNADDIRDRCIEAVNAAYKEKEQQIGSDLMRSVEKQIMLRQLDHHWKEHLAAMDHLRQGIGLRSYAQKNPKQEYKREAFEMFGAMLEQVKQQTISILSRIRIQSEEEVDEMARQRRLAQEKAMQFQHAQAQTIGSSSEQPAAGSPQSGAQPAPRQQEAAPFVREGRKVGRNEPCPCGSGKKYKQCHGKLN